MARVMGTFIEWNLGKKDASLFVQALAPAPGQIHQRPAPPGPSLIGTDLALTTAGRQSMSSIIPLKSNAWPTSAVTTQASGSSQDPQSAMNAFAALLAESMALQTQSQAQGTNLAGASSASTGTAGVQGLTSAGQTTASSDLSALGQALAGGNLAAAQQAFQTLQTDLQSVQQGTQQTHHSHHHHAAMAQSGQDSQDALATGGSASASSSGQDATSSDLAANLALLAGSVPNFNLS
jgi:hypothetical protein